MFGALGWFAYSNGITSTNKNEENAGLEQSMQHDDIQVTPIKHATAVIRIAGKTIYTDPTGGVEAFVGQPPADIVLVTDIHGDHFSTSTLAAVLGSAALVVPRAVKDLLPPELAEKATALDNDSSLTEQGLKITAVPMYNLPGAVNEGFHPRGRGNGYLVEGNGARLYIAGDTAGTPEMRALTDIDVALIPMNMPYTMNFEDAADAVIAFKPRKVFPYHYHGDNDAQNLSQFTQRVHRGDPTIEVVLAEWYPN